MNNERHTESRNKREGWYAGRSTKWAVRGRRNLRLPGDHMAVLRNKS